MITVAITLGDPGGIGPEVALLALRRARWPRDCRFVLIGSPAVVRARAAHLRLPPPPAWRPADDRFPARTVLWDPDGDSPPITARSERAPHRKIRPNVAPAWRPGFTGPAQARAAIGWIHAGVSGCLAGVFDALVTGPICKQSLRLAGLPFPGHTEYLAALTRARRFAMMLIGGPLRVALVTRHLPLARVAAAVTRRAVRETVELAAAGAAWLGGPRRAVGVCALNPHAGDGGLLGGEERTIIAPALRALRRRGLAVAGPIPGDVVFHQARRGRFGAVVAMYHDQGLAPLKMLAFESGVNLTLGLPIVRTSPDHGTAFDIAGTGRAHPGSMTAAIRLAIGLARRPNPWAQYKRH